MENIAYYNGRISAVEDMMIPANDRSTYYGDGVYDCTYGVNRVIFAIGEHIDRFFRSCAMLKIDPQMTKAELHDILYSLVDKVDSPDTCVYWQATRGTGMRAHVFPENPKTNLLITVRPHHLLDTHTKFKLITVEDNRYFMCNIKTINLLPNVLAAQAAKDAGCNESVFIRNGYVTECSHCNVSILKDGVFITAPLTNLILPGITRSHLIALCRDLNIPVAERAFSKEELENADEIIISSSSVHGVAASHLNGKEVGGKAPELFEALRNAYHEKLISETRSR